MTTFLIARTDGHATIRSSAVWNAAPAPFYVAAGWAATTAEAAREAFRVRVIGAAIRPTPAPADFDAIGRRIADIAAGATKAADKLWRARFVCSEPRLTCPAYPCLSST